VSQLFRNPKIAALPFQLVSNFIKFFSFKCPGRRFCLLHILNYPASLNLKVCLKKIKKILSRRYIYRQNFTFSPTAPYVCNVKEEEKRGKGKALTLNSGATKFLLIF
jgi:hypothetical protein